MNNLVRQQHFVPAGYLRAWKLKNNEFLSIDKYGNQQKCNENYKYFWMYNLYDAVSIEWIEQKKGKLKKSETLCKLSNPENGIIQYENHLEHIMKSNEDRFYEIRRRIEYDKFHIKYEDWKFLVWFVCLTIYRNPYYFDRFDKFMDLQKAGLFKSGTYCSNMPLVPITTLIHDTRCLYRKVKQLSYCLFFSNATNFYTSDKPVIHFSDNSYFFPLTPYIALFIFNKTECKDIKANHKSFITLSPYAVNVFNQAMIKNCKHHYINIT